MAEKQRVEKVLEDANIKLSSIASDTFRASGKKIIEELIKVELEAGEMAELSRGRLLVRTPILQDVVAHSQNLAVSPER